MNFIIKRTLGALLALQAMNVFAETGNLFNVTTSGAALGQTLNFTLCLTINGKYPLSCQDHTTSQTTLTIKTTASNHTYHYAGIKINTPGYIYTVQGLRGIKLANETVADGFSSIGTVSDTQSATGVVGETGAATLSVSITNLALSISGLTLNGQPSGQARTITVTNASDSTATGLAINYPTWTGTTTATSNCGTTLAAGSQCTITVTPSTTPTSNCSTTGIAPTPGVITVSANGVTPVTSNVVVLNYGCIYQGGYVFAMTETTDTAASIGGTVVTQTDQEARWPDGIVWSSNGAGSASANVSYDIIPGIAETSTTGSSAPTYVGAQTSYNTTYANESTYPFPSSGSFSVCNGRTDGACNSRNILALYDATYSSINYITTNYSTSCDPNQGGTGGCALSEGKTTLTYYAAGRCATVTDGGYSDWYLPAICEMGPNSGGSGGSGCVVGTQNIVSQLPSLLGTTGTNCTYGANCLAGYYWSSTENSVGPQVGAWEQYFASGGGSVQGGPGKYFEDGVRCVRDFK